MMLSPAMNTAATVGRPTDTEGDDAGGNGPRWGYAPSPLRGRGDPHPLAGERPTIETEGDDGGSSASCVGDELHPVAVPTELHHTRQADTPGVCQRYCVAGALRGVDPVESVGVGHCLRRYQLAEVKHHRPGVRALGVGVGLDDHRRQLYAFL